MAQPESALAINHAQLQNTGNIQNTFRVPSLQSVSLPCMTLKQRNELQESANSLKYSLRQMQEMLSFVAYTCDRKENSINELLEVISSSGVRFSSYLSGDDEVVKKITSRLHSVIRKIKKNREDNREAVEEFYDKQNLWLSHIKKTSKTWSKAKNSPDGQFIIQTNSIINSEIENSVQSLRAAVGAQDNLMRAAESMVALLHLPVEPSAISSAKEMDAVLDALWT